MSPMPPMACSRAFPLARSLVLCLVLPLAAGCVSTRCEMDAPYLQSRDGTGLSVPAGLEGYERETSMSVPDATAGTEVRRRRAGAGTCLEEPPTFDAPQVASEEASGDGEAPQVGMVPVEEAGSAGPSAPVPDAGGDSPPASGVEAEIREAMTAWAAAWSAQDPERFFDAYADSFQPGDGMSRGDWRRWKTQQLEAPRWVEVDIAELDIEMLEEGRALVVFQQRYSSDVAADARRRVMELQRTEDGWLIVAEADARSP